MARDPKFKSSWMTVCLWHYITHSLFSQITWGHTKLNDVFQCTFTSTVEGTVAITDEGIELLSCVAREVKEIEALAAEGKNPSPPEGARLPDFTYWP